MFDLVFSNQPERAARISQQCRDARARGAPVYSRAPCQALSMDFKPDSAYPMLMVQPWSGTQDLRPPGLRPRVFLSQAFRDRMRDSLSDGGAHLAFFCDAGFGMHFLGH
jgi:hypothetical protein